MDHRLEQLVIWECGGLPRVVPLDRAHLEQIVQ
jgi:hypothetical protein